MQTKTFKVPNISCGHCVHSVQMEVGEIAGVNKVEASEATQMVTVEWDNPATWEQIQDVLVEINYPPEGVSAN